MQFIDFQIDTLPEDNVREKAEELNTEYRELIDKYSSEYDWDKRYRIGTKIKRIHAKLFNIFIAALYGGDNPPKPKRVLWKLYGFAHISAFEDKSNSGITHGISLCGIHYFDDFEVPGNHEWRKDYKRKMQEQTETRPLCGHCRNKWEKLTGERLS